MSINNLGLYTLPYAEGEREKVIELISKNYNNLCVGAIIKFFRNYTIIRLRRHPELKFAIPELIHDDITPSAFWHVINTAAKSFPWCVELRDPVNGIIEIGKNSNGKPFVKYPDFIKQLVTPNPKITIDYSVINDETLNEEYVGLASRDEKLRVNTPKSLLLNEFNNKLNWMDNTCPDFDYSDIILEIVKAAKEGKFDE